MPRLWICEGRRANVLQAAFERVKRDVPEMAKRRATFAAVYPLFLRYTQSQTKHPGLGMQANDTGGSMSTATTPLARPSASSSKTGKYIFWAVMGLAGISVLIWTDVPLLHQPSDYRTKLMRDIFLLIPRAIAGVVATVLGPFQFSTRFRQRHLARHRLMGKFYVGAVCVAAPMVFFLGRGFSVQEQIAATRREASGCCAR